MNGFRTAVSGVFGALLRTGKEIAQRISLTPTFLGHLLWLLSQRFLELATKGYAGNAAVYSVLRLLSTAVPEPPLRAHTRKDDGSAGDALPYTHPLSQLIRHPNPLMSEFEMWEMVTLHCGITGRSVWWKERSTGGQLLALWPLRPDRVGPIYAKPGDDARVLLGWSYQVPGTFDYIGIPAGDAVVYNSPDPAGESGGMVEGLGPLQVLAAEVGADNEATRYVGSLLANDATPLTVLSVKGAIPSIDDARTIKQAFMADFGGTRRGQPAVVDGDTTITSLGFNLQQLEFPALRKISESRIAGAFGVPAILAGLLVGLEASSTNATLDQLRALFAETTLASYWRRYADVFTQDVASEFDDAIVCEFDLTKVRALAAQSSIRLAEVRDGYVNGALTVNEYREQLGFAPMPDGDVYMYGIAAGRGTETPVSATGSTPLAALPAPQGANGSGTDSQDEPQATKAAHLPATLTDEGTDALQSAFAQLMASLEEPAGAGRQ